MKRKSKVLVGGNNDCQLVGDKFRSWLADHGVTHKWAARHLKVPLATLSCWLCNEHTPSTYLCERIEKLTGGIVQAEAWKKEAMK